MIVIGLTGTKSSGKGEIANYLGIKYNFKYYSLSDIVREEAKVRGLENYTVKDLQNIGNELREKYGSGILAIKIREMFLKSNYSRYIVDGIRNPGEIDELIKINQGEDKFYLISVDAPREKRFEWIIKRARSSDPKTYKDFLAVDARDLGNEEYKTGQQVALCMKRADFIIKNDSTIEELHNKIDEIMKYLNIEMDIENH